MATSRFDFQNETSSFFPTIRAHILSRIVRAYAYRVSDIHIYVILKITYIIIIMMITVERE